MVKENITLDIELLQGFLQNIPKRKHLPSDWSKNGIGFCLLNHQNN